MLNPIHVFAGLLIGLLERTGLARRRCRHRICVFSRKRAWARRSSLRVRAESRAAAQAAEERVLREIDRLAAIFSGYDPASELSRWQDRRPASRNVSPELFEVLECSDVWIRKTAGAFDPRAEALTRLWSSCARQDRRPTRMSCSRARALMSRRPGSSTRPLGRPSALGLPAQLERNRQGLHRRPGLRSGLDDSKESRACC